MYTQWASIRFFLHRDRTDWIFPNCSKNLLAANSSFWKDKNFNCQFRSSHFNLTLTNHEKMNQKLTRQFWWRWIFKTVTWTVRSGSSPDRIWFNLRTKRAITGINIHNYENETSVTLCFSDRIFSIFVVISSAIYRTSNKTQLTDGIQMHPFIYFWNVKTVLRLVPGNPKTSHVLRYTKQFM